MRNLNLPRVNNLWPLDKKKTKKLFSKLYRRYIGRFVFFFFNFFTSLHFCVGFVSDISVNYRYIGDIERFFSIFSRNDFHLQKSCCDGSTLEISAIFHDIFNPGFH